MNKLRGFIPNLTAALNIALLVVVYLDLRNPMMGFLVGAPFLVLVAATCICSVITAVLFYIGARGRKTKRDPVKK